MIVHINDKKEIQSDSEHSLNTAKICKDLGEKVGISNLCFLEGLLHDLGKSRQALRKKDIVVSNLWNSPIILTSMVRLLETMFSSDTTSVRRFNKLLNSVIIIDEIQNLLQRLSWSFYFIT